MSIFNIKKLAAITLFMLLIGQLDAQNSAEQKAVHLAGTVDENNNVILRWVPLDVESWEWGNEQGYDLHRFTVIDENGNETPPNLIGTTRVILAEGLKPLPEAEWTPLIANSDMAGVASGAIYSDQFDVTTDTSGYSKAYSAVKEKENRHNFSLLAADDNMEVAQAMGVAFVDETVVANATYTYALKLSNTSPTDARSAGLTIEVDGPAITIAPQDLVLLPGDSVMQVTWTYDEDAPYTSYVVERSDDGGQTYISVNDQPIVFAGDDGPDQRLYYADPLPNNDQTFTYRIKGKTPFGIFGPNSETESAKGIPAPVEGPIKITEGIANENKTNTIVWDFPKEQEGELRGFKVLRSTIRNGIYEEITRELLPVERRTFSDDQPESSSYYKVVALDVNDQELASFAELIQIDDAEPPAIPNGLEGTCTVGGVITLTWDQNSEDDFKGYRVYVSNHEMGRYTQVTEQWLRNPIFYYNVDMSILADEIFFKTVAIDQRENASDFSKPCRVIRPDIHPPSQAVISNIEALADGIRIAWIPSSSEDAEIHRLERKLSYTNSWSTVQNQSGNGTYFEDITFMDTTATENAPYNYRIVAEDEVGNKSYSEVRTIIPINNLIVDGITDLYGEVFVNEKKAFLSWNATINEDVYGFDIYRSVDQDVYRQYKSVQVADVWAGSTVNAAIDDIGQFIYEDQELISKNRIKYKVQVQMKDGRSSLLSDPVILLIQ